MAFTEVARWDATAELPLLELRSWQRADRLWFNLDWMKRPAGLVSACALHAAVGLLLFRLSGDMLPPNMVEGASHGLKLFTFPQDGETADPPSRQKEQAGGAKSRASTVPAEAEVRPVPTEWTISRIRVPRSGEAAPAVTGPAPGPAMPAPPSGSSGASGPSGFDPYAGASPRRPGEIRSGLQTGYGPGAPGAAAIGPTGVAGASNSSLQAFLTRELRMRFPDLRGSFQLAVQFNRRGEISDIIVKQGELDRPAIRWLRNRLKSEAQLLASASVPGELINLPLISLL